MTMNTSYYVADFTASDPNYLMQGDLYTLFQTNQVISFVQPVYYASIVMQSTDGLGTILVAGVDYTATSTDIDTTTMSRAKNSVPSFNATLVKSITILKTANTLPLQVSLTYQQFYSTSPQSAFSEGNGAIEITPDNYAQLWRMVNAVYQLSSEVNNPASTVSSAPVLLNYDIDGTNTNNLITNEIHVLNTLNGNNVIRPYQGAFFADSVVLTNGSYTLVLGTDYQLYSCDVARTKLTKNPSGVYNLILVTYAYAGSLSLTYHAIGGEVSVQQIANLYTEQQGIVNFLNQTGFVTESSLPDQIVIKSLQNQIQSLGVTMRNLLSGNPTYGDATTGTSVVKQIRANDTAIHWWTLGSLYKVAGSNSIVQADRMSLHIQLVNAKYEADVDIAVDLTNTNAPVTITARNVVYDPGFTLYGTISALAPMAPQMRVVWNTATNSVSGALVQIGLSLASLTDTLSVSDMSGVESCWILDTSTSTKTAPLLPADSSITLPDQASVWTSAGGVSTFVSKTLQSTAGTLISASQVPFSSMDSTSSTNQAIFTSNLPTGFNTADIKTIVMHVTNAASVRYIYNIPVTHSGSLVHGTITIPLGNGNTLGVFDIRIDPTASNLIVGSIYGTSVLADGMSVRYLVAMV